MQKQCAAHADFAYTKWAHNTAAQLNTASWLAACLN